MRIALLSDIHGNLIALDAVLADIEAMGNVDEFWILGDLVAVGAQPVQVLERLKTLSNARYTYGNTDRYITQGTRPRPHRDEVLGDNGKLDAYGEVASTMSWTQGAISTAGWFSFLDALPLEQRLTLPDGTKLLGVHASPGKANGKGLRPDYSCGELAMLLEGCDADLLVVGHTHWPMNTNVGDFHVVNLGSIGNPVTPGRKAWYALLEADADGYHIRQRRVAYDHRAVYATLAEARHPASDYIASFLRGEREPAWQSWALPPVKDG